ncbi:MAG: tRNA epoxyqueuosine(34) reductase QueG, partial [Bdellovibrionaceae bacterium]|nr:tRNA epoxyqueuosine(34) reductase QueG [Pseudobdellovibrionaceae bacterium]
ATSITPSAESLLRYSEWLQSDRHADLHWMEEHYPIKADPSRRWPLVRSAIVLAKNYVPHPYPSPNSSLRVALYASGRDYHLWLKEEALEVCEELRRQFPGEFFAVATDSQPLLERDLAHRAGLGWFGRNTCLIHPKKGSLFLIVEILTSLEILTVPKLIPDFCGRCTACIEACPTGALDPQKGLDSRLCISYWTIEAKTLPPEPLRAQMGDWFFGCDICQTVCPWNKKVFTDKLDSRPQRALSPQERQKVIAELQEILLLSGKALQRKFAGTPLLRAGPHGLRRNAIIVAGNLRLHELKESVQEACRKDIRLQPLLNWFINQVFS